MLEQIHFPSLLNFLQPLVFILVALFGVGYLLPKSWIHLERALWKMLFGGSLASEWIINYAVKDFQLSIKERETDSGVQRTLAVPMAILSRIKDLPSLYADLKRMQTGRVEDMFASAIEKLNEGWRSGTPARLLYRYMNIIEELANHPAIDQRERLRGLSSVALVKYALGKLLAGNKLAQRNWREADSLAAIDKPEGKWMSSYALFNSTLFLGHFEDAMNMMADQWSSYYAAFDERQKRTLRNQLSGKMTLNPILTLPRHIILAAAFNDGLGLKIKEEKYWPSKTAFENQRSKDVSEIMRELMWIESWYEEAKSICADELISLNFSHAYAAFYFTLLLLDPQVREEGLQRRLQEQIKDAFNAIEYPAPIVSHYVKHGFSGVYHLACERNLEALESLRLAAVSSSISGNSFAECIFMCCHAVAAARLNPYVDMEVDYYLKDAKKLANAIGGDFYPRFCARAFAAVSMHRGTTGKAQRHLLRSAQGKKGSRIMRIFQPDVQQHSGFTPGWEHLIRS